MLNEFKTDMTKKISELKEEYETKIKGMEIVNDSLTKEVSLLKETNAKLKTQVNMDRQLVQEAAISCNFNEQYSRKNNVKILNFPTKPDENLRQDLIQTIHDDLGVQIHHADITEIHRIPTKNRAQRDKPVIVRLASSEVKRNIMRQKKNLKNNVRVVDDVTKKNLDLIKRLKESSEIESAWYFNTAVYGKTKSGHQMKFDLFDDIHQKIRVQGNSWKSKINGMETLNPLF